MESYVRISPLRKAKNGLCPLLAILILVPFLSCSAKRSNDDPSSSQYTVTATITPPTGSTVAGHETIVVKWDATMDKSTLSISGGTSGIDSTQASLTWSTTAYTDDTLTISVNTTTPKVFWPKGTGKTISVTCTTIEGHTATITATYDVVYRVYVSTTGTPTNTGTRALPLSKISDAITYAGNLKSGTAYSSETSEVCVAQGTYPTNWAAGTDRITMVEGISLYGGYSPTDWTVRDRTIYTTTITDGSSTGGTTYSDANRAIDFNTSSITIATVLDGFTINGGGSTYATAIAVYAGAVPTIQNNIINGGSTQTGRTYGIINTSSPLIQNNTINGGKGYVSAGGSSGYSYGIYSQKITGISCIPAITGNTIDGGSGYNSYGIYLFSTDSANILQNSISGGTGDQISYAIYTYSTTTLSIFNNLIFGGKGKLQTYSVYCWATSPKIYNNTIDGGNSNSPSPAFVACVYVRDTSTPQIANNLLFYTDTYSALNVHFGVYDLTSTSLTISNNDFSNFSSTNDALYAVGPAPTTTPPTPTTKITSVGSLSGTGNISTPPVFVSYLSTTAWTSADLHLTSSSANDPIRISGLDGSALGWGFTVNKDGSTRTGNGTTGWSIGAY